MTSTNPRSRPAFTLVEILVVIGVMVLLASIALPIINTARRNADRSRTKLDLNAIAMALDAYKQDFKDYPRPPRDRPTDQVLAWALIGPFDAAQDGADGPGFRTYYNASGAGSAATGSKVWGPYLAAEKFPLSADKLFLLDRYNSPIEYFPRWRAARINPTQPIFNVNNTTTPGIYDHRQADPDPLTRDGTTPKAALYFQKALGDANNDDVISGAGETLGNCPDFLLLSRGAAGGFDFKDKADLQTKKLDKLSAVSNLP